MGGGLGAFDDSDAAHPGLALSLPLQRESMYQQPRRRYIHRYKVIQCNANALLVRLCLPSILHHVQWLWGQHHEILHGHKQSNHRVEQSSRDLALLLAQARFRSRGLQHPETSWLLPNRPGRSILQQDPRI